MSPCMVLQLIWIGGGGGGGEGVTFEGGGGF